MSRDSGFGARDWKTLAGAAVMLPCVVLAALSGWWFAAGIAGHGLWPPDEVTLAEAVTTGNNAEALHLIALGSDPNRASRVRKGLLIDGHDTLVTPVEAAVGTARADSLRMLLANGAVIDERERLVLRCYQRIRRSPAVREILDAGVSGEPDCSRVTLPVDRKDSE
jgi:hypothetical protein